MGDKVEINLHHLTRHYPYFSRTFKKITGMRPSEFKKQWMEVPGFTGGLNVEVIKSGQVKTSV